MTNSKLQTLIAATSTAALNYGKSSIGYDAMVIKTIAESKSLEDLNELGLSIWNKYTKARFTAVDRAAAFNKVRIATNKILKGADIPFLNEVVTLKTKGIISGKAKPTGGKIPKGTKKSGLPTKTENTADASKVLAKAAGANFDDRLFAISQAMKAANVNASEVMNYLFTGLTPEAQKITVDHFTANQKPMVSNKIKIKQTNKKAK